MREVNQRYISYPNRTYRRRINRLWCLFSVATSGFYYRRHIVNWISDDN